MTEKEFYEQQKAIYAPVAAMLDTIPLGVRVPSDWKAPEGYTLEKFEVEGIPVEHLIPEKKKTERIIFQVHGGGYVIALIDPYREAAVSYSQMAGGAEVFSIDYRVAPPDKYPAALDDAVKVYKWLLEQGYDNENMVIVGDSAGGNLALVTTLYLKDHNIPVPKGVIAISPWSKLNNEAESYKRNAYKDCVLGKEGISVAQEVVKPSYLSNQAVEYKDSYVSPVYGDYKGFSNLLIQIGSHEVLLDDAAEVARKAEEAGVNVTFSVYPRMSHDFQLFAPMLDESQEAWREMSTFVNSIFE